MAEASRPPDLLRRPKRQTICGLCFSPFSGANPRTDDHVLPRNWFDDDPPPNLPTWDVCHPCQQDLSPREERLVNTLASTYSYHPEALQQVVARTRRSRRVAPILRTDFVRAPGGVLVRAPIKRPRQVDVDRVFRKVTRGLFVWRHGTQQADVPAAARILGIDDLTNLSNTHAVGRRVPIQRLGRNVWWIHDSDAHSSDGIWIFMLFGAVGVGVWSGSLVREAVRPAAGVAVTES